MRLSHLPLLRALAGLAIAIASPGVELTHGMAHDPGHHSEESRPFSHHSASAVRADDHSSDHQHHKVSEALGIRADLSNVIPVPSVAVVWDAPAISSRVASPASDAKLPGDRATGPPPRLRAPPVD